MVGAGFIGLELAENLHLKGIKVTIVDVADHVICAFLMEDIKYKNIILADDDRTIILAKGYFQGFYEALHMLNQMKQELNLDSFHYPNNE